jgi:hypothetical protein
LCQPGYIGELAIYALAQIPSFWSGGQATFLAYAASPKSWLRSGGIQEDISQIDTWPFDASIIARLAAITLSIFGILLSGAIRDLLRF